MVPASPTGSSYNPSFYGTAPTSTATRWNTNASQQVFQPVQAAPVPVHPTTSTPWGTIALTAGGLGVAGLVGWLFYQEHHAPNKTNPPATPHQPNPTPAASVSHSTHQTQTTTINNNTGTTTTTPTTTNRPPLPKWKKIGLYILAPTAVLGIITGFFASLPKRIASPSLGQIEQSWLEQRIPVATKNPLYNLNFYCTELAENSTNNRGILWVKKQPTNPQLITSEPQSLMLLNTKTSCESLVPTLNLWGKNTPSPMLTLVLDKNNKPIGIALPKPATEAVLAQTINANTPLNALNPKLQTIVPFISTPQNPAQLIALGKQLDTFNPSSYSAKFIGIAPRIEASASNLQAPIPIETRYLPEDLKPLVSRALNLIQQTPEGKVLVEKAAQYKVALQYSVDGKKFSQNGSYSNEDNAIQFKSSTLNKEMDFSFIVKVIIHELGHAVLTNERMAAAGIPRKPSRNVYDAKGNLISGVLDLNDFASQNNSQLEELTVDALANTLTQQILGKLPVFMELIDFSTSKTIPPLQTALTPDYLLTYGIHSHSGLGTLAPTTTQPADEMYRTLGLGDFSAIPPIAEQVNKIQKEKDAAAKRAYQQRSTK